MSLFNREEVIDQNFTRCVADEEFPNAKTELYLSQNNIQKTELISIFESQVISRHIDIYARELKDKGECFYTIGSSGHEGNAVFGRLFPYSDIAFLHYRSAPFFFRKIKANT